MKASTFAEAPSLETTASPAPAATVVSITNQLAVPIDIYDVFNPSTDTEQSPILYTKLATVASNATASVTMIREVALLNAAVSGKFTELNGNYYEQFPIKSMSGTQVTFGTPPPLAYTITAADRTTAVRSFQFHKFISANPTAALAKNFNAALKTSFAAVNTFFKSTDNYKTCTMASWHAVMTWLQNVTSGWQGPYFLYDAPSPMPANYTPQLIATVNITSDATTNSAVLTICGQDATGNPVFSNPPEQINLVMMGDGTMQESDPGSGSGVAVSLTPVWMNVIQTPLDSSGTPVPKYLIGSSLTGTVAGTAVVASQTARQLPGQPAPADPHTQSTWDKIYEKGLGAVGGLAGLVAIYEFAKKAYDHWQEKRAKAKKDAKDADDLAKKNKAADDQATAELSDPKSGLPAIEAQTAAAAQQVSDSYDATTTEVKKATVTEAIDENLANVEQTVQTDIENGVPPSEQFETAFTDAQTAANDALAKVDEGDFTSWKPELDTAIGNLSTEAASASTEIAQSVQELQQGVEEAAEQTQAVDEAQQAREQEQQSAENDSGADPETVNEEPETTEVPTVEA